MTRLPDRRRAGLAWLEVIIIVVTFGVLIGLAAPPYRAFRRTALATKIASDVSQVQGTALRYFNEQGSWPSVPPQGGVPNELSTRLNGVVSWGTGDYRIVFDVWPTPGGIPPRSRASALVGVTVLTSDPRLGLAIMKALGASPKFSYGDRYTLVVAGL